MAAALKTVDLRPTVPIIVAMVSMLNAFSDFENLSHCLINMQKALENLKGLNIWWQSLSVAERRATENKEHLVSTTEEQADAYVSAWKKTTKSSHNKHSDGKGKEEKDDKKEDANDKDK